MVATLRVGSLEINLVERCVRAGDVRIHLTSLEQALLYLLATAPGSIITRDAILDAVWGVDFVPDNNALERQVSRLRAKLRRHLPDICRIETVRGHGYRLIPREP
ncbi:MAG: response regulator transcription factor [Chloroflexi bacterium]|nr:response regulator transcription factor [Chloroflexota bacterium]